MEETQNNMLTQATEKSLVILDEVGRGTKYVWMVLANSAGVVE